MSAQVFDVELFNQLPKAIEEVEQLKAAQLKSVQALEAVADDVNVPNVTKAKEFDVDSTNAYVTKNLDSLIEVLQNAHRELGEAGRAMGHDI